MSLAIRGLFVAVLASTLGCNLAPPRIFRPGSGPYQQQRATVHDPYPDVDMAPAFDGGRPRAFGTPQAEPVRSKPWYDR
jgi:hypothetical protein